MKKLSFTNLLSANQISKEDISLIFDLAAKYKKDVQKNKNKKYDLLKGYILGTMFFEPSTRTRFSFESAMLRLGGDVISLEQGMSSAVTKGESLSDMGRVVSNYVNAVVVRHPLNNSSLQFSQNCPIPVINGGDGTNEHPTQSLTDLFTINEEKGKLNNLKIGFVGDLKYGRTIYSLIKLLNLYENNQFTLISHPSSKLNDKKMANLEDLGCNIIETEDLSGNLPDLDVLYVTRVQKERFDDLSEYEMVKNQYHINSKLLQKAKSNIIIMHPLPRIDEISIDVDELSIAKYFTQAQNSLFTRMGLLSLMLG